MNAERSAVPVTCELACITTEEPRSTTCTLFSSVVDFLVSFLVFFLVLAQYGISTAFGCRSISLIHLRSGLLRVWRSMMVHFQPVVPCSEPGNLMIRLVSAVTVLSTGNPAASTSLSNSLRVALISSSRKRGSSTANFSLSRSLSTTWKPLLPL